MFRDSRGIIQDRFVDRFSMTADDKKIISFPLASTESDQRRNDD